jgi:hypothetical protein
VLDRLLPLGGQQRRHVPHGEHDVHLGRLQRAHGAPGLLGVGGGEQLVRDDGRPRRLLRLAGENLPLTRPGTRRVAGQFLEAAQVLAGPVVVLRVMAGQHHAAGRQPGPVAPHHLLQEGGAGLGLADVQEHLRRGCHRNHLAGSGAGVLVSG